MRPTLLSLCFVVIVGCKVANPNFCPASNPDDPCHLIDSGGMDCKVSSDCVTKPDEKVCKKPENKCVQCTPEEAGACVEKTPICNAMSNRCEGCDKHSDCPESGVCRTDGSCAPPGSVAYYAPAPTGTDNSNCTKTEKCSVFAKALETTREYIKIEGEHTSSITVTRSVEIFGEQSPRAKLNVTSGTIVAINATNPTIVIHDIEINGGGNLTTGFSLTQPATVTLDKVLITRNGGGAVNVTDGNITIQNSSIDGNLGGGILVSGNGTRYTISNNFIVVNGLDVGMPSVRGGLELSTNTSGNKLEFNTIVFNRSNGNRAPGVDCAGDTVLSGNIIYANVAPGNEQFKGNCTLVATTNYSSSMNVGVAPHLGMAGPTMIPGGNFKLTSSSPTDIVNKVTTGCTPMDFEGDKRPTNGACELGADELP